MTLKDTVTYFRTQRRCLVETNPQYKFIYRVLEDQLGKLNVTKEEEVNETLHSVFDYYRHAYGKEKGVSYKLMLKTGDTNNWYRSDDTITGIWV